MSETEQVIQLKKDGFLCDKCGILIMFRALAVLHKKQYAHRIIQLEYTEKGDLEE